MVAHCHVFQLENCSGLHGLRSSPEPMCIDPSDLVGLKQFGMRDSLAVWCEDC